MVTVQKILSALFLLSLLLSNVATSQIVLSEIMFDPAGNENYDEFIEIYNNSDSDSVDVAGWQISDGSGTDAIIAVQNCTKLAPLQFGLILDPGYFENSTRYNELIPETALLLTIDNNTFGSGGLSNSQAEFISLITSSGDTIANYLYSLGNEAGHSDEKIDLLGSDAAENWADCKTIHGTPGTFNSVRLLSYNLSIALDAEPDSLPPGETLKLTAIISNTGSRSVANFAVIFSQDSNADSIFQPDEMVFQTTVTDTLKSNHSITVECLLDSLASGIHQFLVTADLPADEEPTNNSDAKTIRVGYFPATIVINEIMYQPVARQPEWIELFNPGDSPINLGDWSFSDNILTDKISFGDTALIIDALDYLILTADTTIFQNFPSILCPVFVPHQGFPTLNNDGDVIYLYDLIGSIIDQVAYSPAMGDAAGFSLERIHANRGSNDPANWALSNDSLGATPGRRNSVTPRDFDLALGSLTYSPHNPFPGEEVSISCQLKNVGLQSTTGFLIQYFLDLNANKNFEAEELLGESESVSQVIAAEDSLLVPFSYLAELSGRFALLAQLKLATDQVPKNDTLSTLLSIGFDKNSLVINEIMYAPDDGQPEWIELYNPLTQPVDLTCWNFSDSDSSSSVKITSQPLKLQPQSYFVLSQNYTLPDYFENETINFSVPPNFPNLNNDEDFVFLFDGNKNIIDAVQYWDRWNSRDGFSLERINPGLGANDSCNWSASVNSLGGTPGKQNSIFVDVLPSDAALSISPNPFSPDDDGRDDITVISYQLPFNLSQVNIKIYDVRGRLVRLLVNNQPSAVNNRTIWDGRDNDGHDCRMGIYIVFLEAIHYSEGAVRTLKKSVVLAKQL